MTLTLHLNPHYPLNQPRTYRDLMYLSWVNLKLDTTNDQGTVIVYDYPTRIAGEPKNPIQVPPPPPPPPPPVPGFVNLLEVTSDVDRQLAENAFQPFSLVSNYRKLFVLKSEFSPGVGTRDTLRIWFIAKRKISDSQNGLVVTGVDELVLTIETDDGYLEGKIAPGIEIEEPDVIRPWP